jgi:hypothetical protein
MENASRVIRRRLYTHDAVVGEIEEFKRKSYSDAQWGKRIFAIGLFMPVGAPNYDWRQP